MLHNEIVPRIMKITGQNFKHTYFQQDGASPYYGRNVRNYLDVVFNDRWIRRRGYTELPARSLDLSPLDYFLWGVISKIEYKTKPQNLRQRILNECAIIPVSILRMQSVVFIFYWVTVKRLTENSLSTY